jgi:hypothetical protein
VRTAGEGEDIRPAEVVREIQKGERFADVTAEIEALTRANDKEYAWVVTVEDKRLIVTGGLDGIEFRDMDLRGMVMHSHPPGSLPGHSIFDSAFLENHFQKSAWLLEVDETSSTLGRYTQTYP